MLPRSYKRPQQGVHAPGYCSRKIAPSIRFRGKTYYRCCSGCLAAFQQSAAIYSHAIDPVDRSSVEADAPAYAYQGHAYYFASASNLAAIARDPKKFIHNRASSLTGS
jgi:YHS domain-containing protein